MDYHGHEFSKPKNPEIAESYALSGKVMLTSVITFFLVVLLLISFHLYSRWRVHLTRRHHLHRHRLLFSLSSSRGLSPSVISALPTFVYAAADNPAAKAPECAVCLSEFEAGQSGRVLPKCMHRFHVECIDTWLRARSSCPLCRSPVRPEPPVCSGESSSSLRDSPLPPPVECRRKPVELEGIVVELAGGVGNRTGSEAVSGSNSSRVGPDLSLKRFVSI